MQLSQYTMLIPLDTAENEYIAYNTRTQALLGINADIKHALERLPDVTLFTGSNESVLSALYENGIVVHNADEDRQMLNDYYYQIEHAKNRFSYEALILTTLDCNFACPYCFEEGSKRKTYMSEETADRVIAWLKHSVLLNGYKKLHVTFYGGEPLLHKKPIYYISTYMRSWAEEHNINYSFGMVTNGYLMTPSDVDEWIKLGLTRFQISLDGDKHSHDQRRVLLNGAGTFERIVDNIEAVIDKRIKISLSGNYDRNNMGAIFRLLDYLAERGLLKKIDDFAFSPILPRLGPKANPGAVELTDCLSRHSNEYEKMNELLRNEMKSRGLPVPSGIGYMACMLVSRHDGIIIDPEGKLYKCPTMVGYPEFSVGTIMEKSCNEQNEMFLGLHAWERCERDCPYIPICNGGCRFMAFARHGNFTSIMCERDKLDRTLPDLIRSEYRKHQQQPVESPVK